MLRAYRSLLQIQSPFSISDSLIYPPVGLFHLAPQTQPVTSEFAIILTNCFHFSLLFHLVIPGHHLANSGQLQPQDLGISNSTTNIKVHPFRDLRIS